MKLIDLSADVKVTKDNYLSLYTDVIFAGFFVKITCSVVQFVFFSAFYILLEFIFKFVIIKSFYSYLINWSLMANTFLVIFLAHSSF